jgi:hypothetical protein
MRVLPILLLLATPVLAEAPPACTPMREGMVACFGEKLCECRWEPGGSLPGRPAGHRWDCGALRPACGMAPAGPPAAELPPISVMPLLQPPGLPSLMPRSGAGAAPHGTR